ncbi:ABC transporter substrate-binding protein [Acidisoma sp.]|uniref:ABC transporter substrate-binding protein n=1 Tax=Acidisoma sp. TaxID=1872115 RepID=UPI003AFFDCB5
MSLPLLLTARQAAAQNAADPATVPVTQFYSSLLQAMKTGHSLPFRQRYQMLAPAVDAAFDLSGILRISVGAFWSTLPPAQQQTLFQVFRSYTIANYVASFRSAKDRVIAVDPTTRPVGSERVVTTTITKHGRDPLRIDYVMRDEDAGWKAVDVLLDGTISRVAVQRSDFASLVTAGNAMPLINSLRSKVSTLSNGSMTA